MSVTFLTNEDELELNSKIELKADKTEVPTKITDLEDNTNDLNPINYARFADSSYLAENVKNAENANIAQYAERDYINNVIHETYATKAELTVLNDTVYTYITADDVKWTNSTIYNGDVSSNATAITSDYIKVMPGVIKISTDYIVRITYYDKDKKYVSNTGSYVNMTQYTVTDEGYIRIGMGNNNPITPDAGNSSNIRFSILQSDNFKNLSDNIEKLSAEIENCKKGYKVILSDIANEWRQGTYDENAAVVDSLSRITTKTLFLLEKSNTLSVETNGLYIRTAFFRKDNNTYTFVKETSWNNENYKITNEEDLYFCIICANGADYDSSTEITIDDMIANFKIYYREEIPTKLSDLELDCAVTSAENDSDGNKITETYATKTEVNNRAWALTNYPVILGSNGELYVEKSGNNYYIKPVAKGTTNPVTICIYGGGKETQYTWSTVKSHLGSKIKTSPNGVKECVEVTNYCTFFFNTKNNTFWSGFTYATDWSFCIPLFVNNGGLAGGRLNDWRLKDLPETIKEIQNKTSNLSAIPEYYNNEILDTRNKISELPSDNFNYLVITDLHYSHSDFTEARLDGLMKTITYLADNNNIDAVVYLGDSIEGGDTASKTRSKGEIYKLVDCFAQNKKPVLFAFGNHDNNEFDYPNTSEYPSGHTTEHYISTNEWINMCTRPFGHSNDCYYLDFLDKKIRFIIANTCDYDETITDGVVTINGYTEILTRAEQLDKISDMLSETEYDIVIGTHALDTNLLSLVKAFNENGTYQKADGSTVDFSTKTNKIVMYNCGHYHNDAFEYCAAYSVNTNSTSVGSLATVQQNCYGSNNILTSWVDTPGEGRTVQRVAGTVTEASFDIVSIGTDKITKIKFGAGDDVELSLD